MCSVSHSRLFLPPSHSCRLLLLLLLLYHAVSKTPVLETQWRRADGRTDIGTEETERQFNHRSFHLQHKGPCSTARHLHGSVKEEICTFIALPLNINCLLGRDAVWYGTMNWYFEGACCNYNQGKGKGIP